MFFEINGSKCLYGDLLNALFAFVIAAASVYFLVVPDQSPHVQGQEDTRPQHPPVAECLSEIPLQARRCEFSRRRLVLPKIALSYRRRPRSE